MNTCQRVIGYRPHKQAFHRVDAHVMQESHPLQQQHRHLIRYCPPDSARIVTPKHTKLKSPSFLSVFQRIKIARAYTYHALLNERALVATL